MIVAAVDDEDRMEKIVSFAAEEAKLRGQKLNIIHSLFGGDKTGQKDVERARELLERAEKVARDYGVEVETHLLVRGLEPADDIIAFSEENNAELIVMGVRKRSPVGKLLFGSVAQRVILNTDIPVMCIK